MLIRIVGRRRNHLVAVSLNSSQSKTPDLPLEFRRYLYQFQRYNFVRFRRPYCYGCSCHIDNDTVRQRVHVLNIELCIQHHSEKIVVSFQTASISELECQLFLFPVFAAILNLLYISGRTFTTCGMHKSRLLTCMQSSMKFASELCHILVFGLLLPVGGTKIHFLLHD